MIRSILAAALGTLAFAASAQLTRMIPENALRGRISFEVENIVRIDGTRALLAANARIMSPDNLTIVPGAIPPNSISRFQIDQNGHISRVWLLNPVEAVPAGGRLR